MNDESHDERVSSEGAERVPPKRIAAVLEQFDPRDVRAALRLVDRAYVLRDAEAAQPVVNVAGGVPPTGILMPEMLLRAPSLTELSTSLVALQPFLALLPQEEIDDLIRKFKAYFTDPKQLITGINSSGERKDYEKAWRASCRQSPEQKPPEATRASIEWYVWDHTIDGEITTHVVLSWEADECHVYNADYTITIQRNDEPEDYGVIMWETYSTPPTAADDPYVCHPCTPKCLRAQASVVFYVLSATTGLPKGISHKVNLDVLICPPPKGAQDETNYAQNQGDGNGPKSPQKPPVAPHPTNAGTWGASKTIQAAPGYSPS